MREEADAKIPQNTPPGLPEYPAIHAPRQAGNPEQHPPDNAAHRPACQHMAMARAGGSRLSCFSDAGGGVMDDDRHRLCLVDGCQKVKVARRLCGTHYARWRRTGSTNLNARHNTRITKTCTECGSRFHVVPSKRNIAKYCSRKCLGVANARRQTLIPDFAAFLRGYGNQGGCWDWPHNRDRDGYGVTTVGGATTRCHRVAYETAIGPIPKGAWVLHRCDNPSCIRPAHLFLGDAVANAADMATKGRACRGERHPNAKLTEPAVCNIREDARGCSKLARVYGVSPTTIKNIIGRKTWKHVP